MLTIGGYMRFANTIGAVSIDGNATVNDVPAGHILTFGSMAVGSSAEDTFHSDWCSSGTPIPPTRASPCSTTSPKPATAGRRSC